MGRKDDYKTPGLVIPASLFLAEKNWLWTQHEISTPGRNFLCKRPVHIFTNWSMNSGDSKRERDIIITLEVTTVERNTLLPNVMDSPRHSDFGRYIKHVIGTVDKSGTLIDATEGKITQTKLLLSKMAFRPTCHTFYYRNWCWIPHK